MQACADQGTRKDFMVTDIRLKNKKKPILYRFAALCILLCITASMLFSCLLQKDSKEDLKNRIKTEDVSSCETITDCFIRWKFPRGYSVSKLRETEQTMRDGYYMALDIRGMAKAAAECFTILYYDEIDFSDTTAYTDALIRCMVLSLGDDYAVYRTKAEYQSYAQSMSGTYGGIGMTVRKDFDTGRITVTRLISDSPAQRAGVLIGDILYSVEGLVVTKENMEEAFAKMQGDVGQTVHFELLRGETIIPFAIVRENMENMTVSYTLSEEKIAYITVTSFKQSTYEYFKKAVDAAEAAGAIGFIFDMRDNPGGYLSSVLNVLDYLVPDDTELCSYGTDKSTTVYVGSEAYDGKGVDHVISVPCVVICNGATASAGELFTAALRDYNDMKIMKATVVGTEKATYGKGIMQSSYHLTDGSVLTVTSAFYNPPCGVNYHGEGVKPDILCEEAEALETARQALMDLIDKK